MTFPKTYHVESKALAQTNSALKASAGTRTPGPIHHARVAADTVLRQDNLLALIKETDLLRHTREHRAPAERARDAIVHVFRRQEDSEADRLDALVKRLEKKLVKSGPAMAEAR